MAPSRMSLFAPSREWAQSEAYPEWTGSDGDDVHEVDPNIIGRFDGGEGNDTLRVNEAGYVRLYDLDITSIETIEGANGNSTFALGTDVLPKIKHIKGGTGHNTLSLVGQVFDLSKVILSNIHEITYSFLVGLPPTNIIVGDFETAMLVTASPYHQAYITLAQGTFTDAQKGSLYAKGLIYLRDDGGDHINPRPLMNNFHNDKLRIKAGEAGLLDQGDQLILQGGSPYMKALSVGTTGFRDISDLYGIKVTSTGAVSLSGALAKGVDILVNGVVIGSVAQFSSAGLEITFNTDATVARVQELLRALTYTNTDPLQISEKKIEVVLTDHLNRTDKAAIDATIAPDNTQFEDPFEWKGIPKPLQDNNFSTREGLQLRGNGINGTGGQDTLFLSGGGFFNLHEHYLKNVPIIRGSNKNDIVTFAPGSIKDVRLVDLRGKQTNDYDIVRLNGVFFDLSGKTFESVNVIKLMMHSTVVGLDSAQNARLIDGTKTRNDHIVLTKGTFSGFDFAQMKAHGIEYITDQRGLVSSPGVVRIGTKAKDTLTGTLGDDKIYGKSGNDKLTGKAGLDAFVFNTKLGTSKTDRQVNFDTITDFKRGEDKIWLDNKIFKKIGSGSLSKPGALSKSFFKKTKATDKNDYLIYKSGILSFDADGSGKKSAPVEFLKIANRAALSAEDFIVI